MSGQPFQKQRQTYNNNKNNNNHPKSDYQESSNTRQSQPNTNRTTPDSGLGTDDQNKQDRNRGPSGINKPAPFSQNTMRQGGGRGNVPPGFQHQNAAAGGQPPAPMYFPQQGQQPPQQGNMQQHQHQGNMYGGPPEGMQGQYDNGQYGGYNQQYNAPHYAQQQMDVNPNYEDPSAKGSFVIHGVHDAYDRPPNQQYNHPQPQNQGVAMAAPGYEGSHAGMEQQHNPGQFRQFQGGPQHHSGFNGQMYAGPPIHQGGNMQQNPFQGNYRNAPQAGQQGMQMMQGPQQGVPAHPQSYYPQQMMGQQGPIQYGQAQPPLYVELPVAVIMKPNEKEREKTGGNPKSKRNSGSSQNSGEKPQGSDPNNDAPAQHVQGPPHQQQQYEQNQINPQAHEFNSTQFNGGYNQPYPNQKMHLNYGNQPNFVAHHPDQMAQVQMQMNYQPHMPPPQQGQFPIGIVGQGMAYGQHFIPNQYARHPEPLMGTRPMNQGRGGHHTYGPNVGMQTNQMYFQQNHPNPRGRGRGRGGFRGNGDHYHSRQNSGQSYEGRQQSFNSGNHGNYRGNHYDPSMQHSMPTHDGNPITGGEDDVNIISNRIESLELANVSRTGSPSKQMLQLIEAKAEEVVIGDSSIVLQQIETVVVSGTNNQPEMVESTEEEQPDGLFCYRCKSNGRPDHEVKSHCIKRPNGEVWCPELIASTCDHCGVTGAAAHPSLCCPKKKELDRLEAEARHAESQASRESSRQREEELPQHPSPPIHYDQNSSQNSGMHQRRNSDRVGGPNRGGGYSRGGGRGGMGGGGYQHKPRGGGGRGSMRGGTGGRPDTRKN